MTIAVCEDNRVAAAQMESYILELHLKNLNCDVFYDGKDLIIYLTGNMNQGYQIYLLDIQMPELDGIKTAHLISIKNPFNGEKVDMKTTKKDDGQHGIGLLNVKRMVDSMNGMLSLSTKGNVFQADVLFNFENNSYKE